MADTRRTQRPKATSNRYYDAYRNFGDYYSYTSSAYVIETRPDNEPAEIYEPSRQTPDRRTRRPAAKPQLKPKTKTAPVKRYRIRIDPRVKITREMVFLIIVIFVGMFFIVYTKAMAQSAFGGIKSLNAELSEVRGYNASLSVELYENYNKDEIEEIATTKLNMTKRKPHQEVHVNVPKASYIVQNKPKPAADPRIGLLERLFAMIAGD